MIVADASVLIAHLDENDAHHERAAALLLDAAEDALAASPITIAEVLVGPARAGRLDAAHAALSRLGLREIAIGADAAARLATLRAESGLKLPDCCVLLAAQDAPAQGLLSFHDRLVAAARRLGVARS